MNAVNTNFINKFGVMLCIFGSLLVLFCFTGCYGLFNKVKCILEIYSLILLLGLVIYIGITILFIFYSAKMKQIIIPFLKENINSNYMGDMKNKTLTSIAWDALMFNIDCCGVYNYSDFSHTNNQWKNNETYITPRSCCKVSL